ncbi:amidohydrolase [Auriscalpium vulgare]|uniref:Amidohydrolase n=1 Tax=Auriscalpium vulgare TaxID=40419 RepID=A0ACB8RSC9_9AGAM|nr:amidohydrolase [Auriscalpium vulgare]
MGRGKRGDSAIKQPMEATPVSTEVRQSFSFKIVLPSPNASAASILSRPVYILGLRSLRGCFSGLLKGHRQRAQSHSICSSPQASFESPSKLTEQPPKYVSLSSCCDFSVGLDGRKPPSYDPGPLKEMYRPEVLATIEAKLTELEPELRSLSLTIHDHPETMFEERRHAHDVLTAFLAVRGWAVTPHYLGLATAWRAERAHRGGRVLGVNAEMDALPGLGHACGHNLIAVAGVGVALAVFAALRAHDTPGTVVLLGTPAEESGCGKQLLLDRGGYEGMDACVMCHPAAGATQALGIAPTLALQVIDVEYFGHPAHAAFVPWEGVNALDAAFVAYSSISALRQQIKPAHRVHGVVSGRDWTPNVIPDYAKMSWIVRAGAWDEVEGLRDRVIRCLEAASMATGCKHKITLGDRYFDMRQNRVLAGDLAVTAQRQYGVPTVVRDDAVPASTDFGNVSYALPAVHPTYNIPAAPGAQNHTAGFTKAARTLEAHAATMLTARMLALTAFRVLDDDVFFRDVRRVFEEDRAAR